MNNIVKSIIHEIMELARFIMWHAAPLFPINKKKIIVSCFKGKGYTDNPKYIIEEILKKDNSLTVIWLVKNKNEAKSLPTNVRPCYYNRLSAIYHYITAIIWIDNTRKDEKFVKKNDQFYLQTWHGGGAIKKVEADAMEQLSPTYMEKAIRDSLAADLFIAEGKYYADLIHRSFWYNGPILSVGLPRYDMVILNQNNVELKNKVLDYFSLPHNTKYILYVPTFRKGYGFEHYNIDHYSLINACEKKWGGKFVSYVHLHPNVADKFSELKYDNLKIFNATPYPDIQELITVADILITDYSSAIVDFALTKRPAFRYAVDAPNYAEKRGCYFDFFSEYPFPLALNNKELIDRINSFDIESYGIAIDLYFQKLGVDRMSLCSPVAASLLLDYIKTNDKKQTIQKYTNFNE